VKVDTDKGGRGKRRPPPPEALEGPAFPWSIKILATLTVATVLVGGLRMVAGAGDLSWTQPSAWLLFAAALAMMLWYLFWIWRSRTVADAHGVRQSWMWDKEVAWADVVQSRIVAVAGLEWLVAPRLVVRVRGGGMTVFHAADRRVVKAFAIFVTTGATPPAASD